MKPVRWLGDSLKRVRAFEDEAKHHLGVELSRVQYGREPIDWKPMLSVGPGVREIRVRVDGAYRLVYVAKFGEAVYVLHAFRKKSPKTSRLDIELARIRYKTLERDRG